MSTATTQIIISGKDQLSGVVADAGRRMGTELEGMRRQVLTVNDALAGLAGYFAGGAIGAGVKDVSMLAARYDTLGVVMGVVGNNAGYTRAEMDQFEASLRKTGITAIESRNNISAMASAGMDLSKASQLARVAQDAAVVGNINSSEAFQRMISGIKSAEVEVLRGIGLNVNFEQSYKKVADQLGKNATELTEQEKLQARLNAVLAQAPTIAGVYEESLTTAGKKMSSLSRYSEDARVKLGAVFQPALVLLVDTYTDALKGVNAQLDNTEVIEKWARVIKSEVLDIMQIATSLNMVLAKAGQAATVVGMGIYGPGAALGIENSERGFEYFAKQNLEYQKQFTDSEAYLNKLIGEQANLAKTIKKQTAENISEQARITAGNARRAEEAAAILAGGGGADKKTAAASQKAYEKMITDGKKAAETLDKYWNDYEDGRVKAVADGVAARETANAKDLALVTEFADKYKELILGETGFKLAQIDAQGDAYRKAGADEIAVAQYVKAEKLKYSRDWQDGATRALQAYADEASNSAAAVESVMNAAFQGMENVIVDFVKTGKLEFADLVTSINAEIARLAFKDMAGQMYSFLGDAMGGGKSSSGDSNWLGTALNMGMSALGSYFGGGSSVAAGSAGGGFNYAGEMSSFFSRNAKGGVYDSPSLSAYSGGVYSSPQLFAFAKGAGVFGEAGPEAIMPLKRGPDGTLGVQAGGGNSEMTALLREIASGIKSQRGTKVVNAIGKGAIANELSGSEGEQVIFNHIRRNPAAVRRMLGLS